MTAYDYYTDYENSLYTHSDSLYPHHLTTTFLHPNSLRPFHNFITTLTDTLSNVDFANAFLITISLLHFSIFIFTYASVFYMGYKNKTSDDEECILTIVRGVPGSGKKSYVYALEKDTTDENSFSICYWNDYFYNKGQYEYVHKKLKSIQKMAYKKFLASINYRVPRIYYLSYFEKKEMYEPMVEYAKERGYKVKIVELNCPDKVHLYYFNRRSKHNVPYNKSLNVFSEWECDPRAVVQDPYLDEFKGDSIPSFGTVSKRKLNNDLKQYFKKNPIVNEYRYKKYNYENFHIPKLNETITADSQMNEFRTLYDRGL
jgi:hypothetical protein